MSTLSEQLSAAVHAFGSVAVVAERWEVYWAAGVGSMGSAEKELEPESQALAILLRAINNEPALSSRRGDLAFASSAGAIYAGSADELISERSVPAPTTAYAHAKLAQEELVRSFQRSANNRGALLARISTVYGAGQATGKRQGLLSHIARSIVRNKPIQIYVPFDTIRDYIAADDAATAIVRTLGTLAEGESVTKIIASERPTTIAEIVATFRRISRRAPLVVTSASKLSNLYSRRVQFRSIVLPETARSSKTSLLLGISQVLAAERVAFAAGLKS